MTSAEIRQSFLDFFASKGHTIVPSSSLLPDSPGLLFTNAGMNQFVPIFLGDRAPDVSTWAGARPSKDTRAADTQKCIRAGGKHNDLEDVGYDTYHHTLFEMLGNWSFGDYFKKESLTWGWELLTQVWGIPAKRLFATVYAPKPGDPSEFDHEAAAIWTELFKKEGLDPAIHIVHGNRKDNFWQMGDTGPCGPCSEIHFNLLPSDDEAPGRALVNSSSPRCIEIWNHVFIQFNANADGTFSPLAAKHVDTGMGFERVAGIMATTKKFTDFSAEPSNYNADVFAPLFAKVTELSGKTFKGTVPTKREGLSEQENIDIAFRVLADHARTISCSIADGILPGNEGRNYVIRRILRRGILYGKKLGLKVGFFEQLVAPVVESLGNVFPELKQQQDIIRRVIKAEEESFGRTLDKGLLEFSVAARDFELEQKLLKLRTDIAQEKGMQNGQILANEDIYFLVENLPTNTIEAFEKHQFRTRANLPDFNAQLNRFIVQSRNHKRTNTVISGEHAFRLYDSFGFPLDMTELLATERGFKVDTVGFEKEMEKQRERGRASTKKEIIVAKETVSMSVSLVGAELRTVYPTKFIGYELPEGNSFNLEIIEVINEGDKSFVTFFESPFYAEMGGQVGDTGWFIYEGTRYEITNTIKDSRGAHYHQFTGRLPDDSYGKFVEAGIDLQRRRAIQRHHTATHLLNFALRKVLGTHVRQAGSVNTPDRLRFDFAHFESVKPEQLREIEQIVNTHVLENKVVVSYETEFDKKPEGTLAFFGDKYGKFVRVVDIGGYSRELCGGTHVSTTGEIGLIKVVAEAAIAAGTRRIEAVAGQAALDYIAQREAALNAVSTALSASPLDVAKKLESLLAQQKETEKQLKVFQQKAINELAAELASKATDRDGLKFVSAVVTVDAPETLRSLGSQILAKLGEGVVQLGAVLAADKVSLVAFASPAAIKAGHQAGKIIADLSGKLGGKGGGKPDFAMGGGKETANLAAVLKG